MHSLFDIRFFVMSVIFVAIQKSVAEIKREERQDREGSGKGD